MRSDDHGPLPAGLAADTGRGPGGEPERDPRRGRGSTGISRPSNVLIAEDGPRVIDFGISRAVESTAADAGGPGDRLAGVHVPRAGRRFRSRAAERHLQPRGGAGLRRHGRGAVRRQEHRGLTSALLDNFLAPRPRSRLQSFKHLLGVVRCLLDWSVTSCCRRSHHLPPTRLVPLTPGAPATCYGSRAGYGTVAPIPPGTTGNAHLFTVTYSYDRDRMSCPRPVWFTADSGFCLPAAV